MTDRLVEVAVELYALPLDEFTAARDVRAKELRAAGDRDLAREVAGLRRPTTAAWAVDQLVRAHPQEVEQLLDLGAALRDAQEAFAGAELRELDRQQRRVVAAILQQARAVAAQVGQRLTEAVGRQVEATLRAGMADPAAADAIRSGLLVRELESMGFDPVDTDGAVAVPGAVGGNRPSRGDERRRRERRARGEERAQAERAQAAERAQVERAQAETERAHAEVEEAGRAQRDAEESLARAEEVLATAAARREDLAARLVALRAAVAAAEEEDAAAERALAAAQDAHRRADRAAQDARSTTDRARARLRDLT